MKICTFAALTEILKHRFLRLLVKPLKLKLIKLYGSYILMLVLLLSGKLETRAQIYSNTADFTKELTYNSGDTDDLLFVFYQTNENYTPGALSVNSPSGNASFTWRKYNTATKDFSIFVLDDINKTSSHAPDLNEGGYKVSISYGAGLDTSFIAWVMLDNFSVNIDKSEEGNIYDYNSGCADYNYLYLDGTIVADSFDYYDPITHDKISLVNNFTFEWTSDNSEIEIYNKSRYLSQELLEDNVPVEDTYFILTASDSLGMTEVDSAFLDTKFTRAEFTVEYLDKLWDADDETYTNPQWNADLGEGFSTDIGSLDAPLTVRFINESKNGAEYTWVFVDTMNMISKEGTKISLDTTELDYQPEFTYYNADKYYYPYLVSVSDAPSPCIDTFKLEEGIRVVPSELLVPNVFTPNGDENNDVFIFKHQSLREFKLTIINKFGRVVYKQKVDDIYEWEGWKGTLHNSDTPAPEGQYYYVVEALGYDNIEYKDPNVFEQWKIEKLSGGIGNIPGTGSTPGTGGTDPETQSNNLYTGWLYLYRNIGEY